MFEIQCLLVVYEGFRPRWVRKWPWKWTTQPLLSTGTPLKSLIFVYIWEFLSSIFSEFHVYKVFRPLITSNWINGYLVFLLVNYWEVFQKSTCMGKYELYDNFYWISRSIYFLTALSVDRALAVSRPTTSSIIRTRKVRLSVQSLKYPES